MESEWGRVEGTAGQFSERLHEAMERVRQSVRALNSSEWCFPLLPHTELSSSF